mmetsp:Transcript_11081/g.22370  ORF Transcript_11081/g.22370 Transcript_11081/m.22370 type:complete len:357 (+) Transcript_11081:52-1122(+)
MSTATAPQTVSRVSDAVREQQESGQNPTCTHRLGPVPTLLLSTPTEQLVPNRKHPCACITSRRREDVMHALDVTGGINSFSTGSAEGQGLFNRFHACNRRGVLWMWPQPHQVRAAPHHRDGLLHLDQVVQATCLALLVGELFAQSRTDLVRCAPALGEPRTQVLCHCCMLCVPPDVALERTCFGGHSVLMEVADVHVRGRHPCHFGTQLLQLVLQCFPDSCIHPLLGSHLGCCCLDRPHTLAKLERAERLITVLLIRSHVDHYGRCRAAFERRAEQHRQQRVTKWHVRCARGKRPNHLPECSQRAVDGHGLARCDAFDTSLQDAFRSRQIHKEKLLLAHIAARTLDAVQMDEAVGA